MIHWHGVTDQDIDDGDLYDGTPVGIQLVGRRLQEEKMLAIAEYISKALHG
jgi:amidase